jgi:hypothetical protein
MARKFFALVDLSQGTLVLPLQSPDPASPVAGEAWVNGLALKYEDNSGSPATHVVEIQDNKNAANGYAGLNGSGEVAIAQGGTAASTALAAFNNLSPMSASGDLIYGGTGGSALRLGIGSAAQYLRVTSAVPTWTTIPNTDIPAFTAATSIAAGSTGGVPAPTAGQQNSFLTGASLFRTLVTADIPSLLQFSPIAAPGTLAEGDTWSDSTQKCMVSYIDGLLGYQVRAIFLSTSVPSIINSATETTTIGTGLGGLTIPANWAVVGKTIRIRQMGYMIRGAASTGEWRLYFAPLPWVSGTGVIADTGAVTLNASSGDAAFILDALITVGGIGTSGSVFCVMTVSWVRDTTVSADVNMFGTVGGFFGAYTVNTTVANTINLTFQFGTANSGNGIIIDNTTIEVLG